MKGYFEELEEQGYYLIAEIGVNYYDIAVKNEITLLDAAKLMISEAKQCGINAVKFQSYKAEKLASKVSPAYWDLSEECTKSQFELFKKYDLFGESEYKILKEYCDKLEIMFMSTPFDFEAADYLQELVDVYKISSSDITNLPFLEYIAKKNKPVIISTGASNLDEIHRAVDVIRKYNTQKLTIMHCVLEYPTPMQHANLLKIQSLMKEFPDEIIGYSDHTKPTADGIVQTVAFGMGATVIEKHFTLDKSLKGNDHYHAMDVNDAKKIIHNLKLVQQIKGKAEISCLETEGPARENARRSIVAKCDIKAGTEIKREMLTFKRPGNGISPDRLSDIIGKQALVDIEEDTTLKECMLK
ncbi:MAG: acetylneuraminic acid synthetase [Lachnospiraceae bacterium]|nr:acetylneuraminic acid synthetase [Lachnospiraceae bacterium]